MTHSSYLSRQGKRTQATTAYKNNYDDSKKRSALFYRVAYNTKQGLETQHGCSTEGTDFYITYSQNLRENNNDIRKYTTLLLQF